MPMYVSIAKGSIHVEAVLLGTRAEVLSFMWKELNQLSMHCSILQQKNSPREDISQDGNHNTESVVSWLDISVKPALN